MVRRLEGWAAPHSIILRDARQARSSERENDLP